MALIDPKQIRGGVGGGPGGITVYTADLDFGSVGITTKLFAVANAAALIGQDVFVSIPWDQPAGIPLDELEADPIYAHGIVLADGFVSIQLISVLSTPVIGARRVNYFLV